MDKNALEQLLSTYDSWMGWSTVAVAVGILGEYLAHFIFEEEARRNRREIVVSIVFGALVLGGVTGEYVFGKKLSQVSSRLQQTADLEVAQANKDAAEAKKSANEADAKAEGLRLDVAKEEKRAGQLAKEAADTRAATAKLEARNIDTESQLTEAKKELSKEQTQQLELEQSIAPRSFAIKVTASPDSNFEDLKPFAGTKVVFIVLTDAEARRATNEIGNLVMFAGWKVVSAESNPDLWPGFYDGVSIVPPPGFPPISMMGSDAQSQKTLETQQRTTEAANALALWLIRQNWKASVRYNIQETGKIPEDTIKIFVGFKPDPFFDPDWVKQSDKEYEKMLERDKAIEKSRPQLPK
jgi:hypothetical protein